MGTHPIFESDFDCLTEIVRVGASFDFVVLAASSAETVHWTAWQQL